MLSEGQNLQDCSIIVNYDLPWAIIRLIQRAGRVDRIGQSADRDHLLLVPAGRRRRANHPPAHPRPQRLRENAEVVGTDEAFFEDDADDSVILDLYNEKAGILDGDADTEVDLASYAYQIWKNAIDADPVAAEDHPRPAERRLLDTRRTRPPPSEPEGVLVYLRTGQGNDALAWVERGRRERHRVAVRDPSRRPSARPKTPPLPRTRTITTWCARASS